MKVVLPIHHFPPHYSSGAELYTFRLARWLIEHDHEAEVVCVESIDQNGDQQLTAEYDLYEKVPVWRLSLNARHAREPFQWSYDHPLIGGWFTDYLIHTQPTLVHLQSGYLITPSVLEAAAIQRIPTALTLHDFWFLCPRITLLRGDGSLCTNVPDDPATCAWCMQLVNRRYRLPDRLTNGLLGKTITALNIQHAREEMHARRAYMHKALGWADAVIAPSHFLATMFAGMVPSTRLHVLRYGIDTAHLLSTQPPADDGRLRLGYIGQIASHKGVHILVQAMKLLPTAGRPIELTIYGDLNSHSHYSNRLQKQIGDDARIRLAGRFDHSRITNILSQFDATVVPSIWYENSPLSIMEAHAAGRPVLTSALGGMAELVHDQVDGLLFRAGDANDLAVQIQRLREDPRLLARLRQGIIPPATIDAEMLSLMQIYQNVAKPDISAGLEVV